MSEVWRDFRIGDRICIVQFPAEFSQPGYFLHDDTRVLYEHLIDKRVVLMVENVDEWNVPWVAYVSHKEGDEEYHTIAVNHGSLERVG